MKKPKLPVVYSIIFAMLASSCAVMPPISGTEGQGAARIERFVLAALDNPHAELAPITCDIVEGEREGLIRARYPGGTSPVVSLDWKLRRGSLWADGAELRRGSLLDVSKIESVEAVDAEGRIRKYALDIRVTEAPTVFIATEGAAPILTKTDWVKGSVAIEPGAAPWASALAASSMKVRGRGNSTWGMPKKPYRFTLDKSSSLLDMPAAKKWVLLANYADKSLMRNFVAFDTAPLLEHLRFSPRQRPVALYLNGEYQGAYGLGDQVETGSDRVAIGKADDDPDTAFFLEVNMRIDSEFEGGKPGVDFFTTASGLKLEYKTPDPEDATQRQKESISAFVSKVEEAILAREEYEELIDVDSFIDWLLFEEFFKNQDSQFLSSVYMYRTKGGKLSMGPVWDFDLSAGNSDYGEIGGYALKDPRGWFATYSSWYESLFRDEDFTKAYKARWAEVKNRLIAEVFRSIDRNYEIAAELQKDNFAKWPILGTYVWPNPPELVAADTHDKQVAALRAWFQARFDWMDKAVERLGT